MAVMKRIAGWRAAGLPLAQGGRVFAGLEPPPLTKEDKAELRAAAAEAKAEREAVQAIEREAEAERRQAEAAARLAEWGREAGPPGPPQNPTGFYRCANLPETYFPVGSGPWPDYRPPGLAWRREWNQPKPADVPWADEIPPPKAWAPDPKPIRGEIGKAQQMRLFG